MGSKRCNYSFRTHQITKVFDDKYGYEYANGKNENVPLSFILICQVV